MTRVCPELLEQHYQAACDRPSDINEHLPLLREYASKCEHVTEMGMRGADGSTIALLAAQPKTFIAWDLNPFSVVSQPVANLISMTHGSRTSFEPRTGNTLEINIEKTEMLFIDTLHTAKQLYAELQRHGGNVSKYIAFHDTATFGRTGEDGKAPGLLSAIRQWQMEDAFPLWKLVQDKQNNNGLLILQSIDVLE